MDNLLDVKNGQATVSSLVISEYTDNQHKNIKELITDNISDIKEFGDVIVETIGQKGKKGYSTYYKLNEQQYSLIMTYLRNKPKVKAFKKNMVKAFYILKKQLESQHNGKNIEYIISGYKSQIAQHNRKIEELTKKLSNLKSGQKLLPLKSEEESFFIKAKSLARRKEDKMASFTEIVQYHLSVCIGYIEALRLGGTELQKLTIEKIKKAEDERNKARELQNKAEHERNLIKKKVDEYILVSNELLRVRHRD